MTRFTPALIALCLLASCGKTETPEPATPAPQAAPEPVSALISDGRAIVEVNCKSCHATGSLDESPRSDAPPLRTVLEGRDSEALADDFREGIHVGAVDMPDFDFGPLGTDAVIAYLQSIQVSVPADDTSHQ